MNQKHHLQHLEVIKNKASRDLDAAIRENWPESSRVQVVLRVGQLNPTPATVHGVRSGQLIVILDKPGRHGRHAVKRVWWRNVIAPWPVKPVA